MNRTEYNEKGYLDEVVTDAGVHLERLSKKTWFLNLERQDGSSVAVFFRGKPTSVEERPARGDSFYGGFQGRVLNWFKTCFGDEALSDLEKRGDRLLEEVFELLQSGGYDPARVDRLRNYVWSRDAGNPAQEVGGVMTTLAAYCGAHEIDMAAAGEAELIRVWEKIKKIRMKEDQKPKFSIEAAPLRTAGHDAIPGFITRCDYCNRLVDMREREEGGDTHGCQLNDGRWACSSDCYDIMAPDGLTPCPDLEGLLREAAERIRGYVEAQYPEDDRVAYPSIESKYRRDIDLAHRIDRALSVKSPPPLSRSTDGMPAIYDDAKKKVVLS